MTLVEAVIACVIVGTMLVAALSALGSSARAQRSRAERCLGPHLARALMAEVLQAYYREPAGSPAFGPEAPEASDSRAAWDDVDDYHGWSACPPQSKDGTPLDHAAGWTRSVTVAYVRPDEPNLQSASDQGLKRITVTVVGPAGARCTLTALRSDASLYDRRPAEPTTYVTWIGTEIQIGPSQAARVTSGTHLLAPVPVP
jgi:type II secretory pathway pseudopilin PulG